jgi:hypothetical protein
MSGGNASASCPASKGKKARTTLATTTEQLSELDEKIPSLSYVQDKNLGSVSLKVKGQLVKVCEHSKQVILICSGDDCFVHYEIKKTQALKRLMKHYCILKGLEMNTICFLFDGNRLSKTQTPAELNMKDDDMIEARCTLKSLLSAGAFTAALAAVPAEDWCRTWGMSPQKQFLER